MYTKNTGLTLIEVSIDMSTNGTFLPETEHRVSLSLFFGEIFWKWCGNRARIAGQVSGWKEGWSNWRRTTSMVEVSLVVKTFQIFSNPCWITPFYLKKKWTLVFHYPSRTRAAALATAKARISLNELDSSQIEFSSISRVFKKLMKLHVHLQIINGEKKNQFDF